jgi:hemerythrin-like domain-containing protein
MAAIQLIHNPHMEHKESLCKSGQTDSLSLCTNQAQVTSLAEIVKEDYPLSIIRAKNEQGVETLAAHVISKINYYQEAVGIKNPMNEAQVLLCAKFMIDEHPHLPLKALDIFFDEAIKGNLGEHYNKMDIPTMLQWLKKFENNYFDMVEEQAYAEHMSTKGDKGIDLMALAKSKMQEECVPMPEEMQRRLHLKREETLADKIRAKVIKENSHLFSTLSFEDAQEQITSIVNDELIKQGIFNLD